MSLKGLELILAKIKVEPRSNLVNRYLALIAEISDEGEKQGRALELAELLSKTKPGQALRIAHMVYRESPDNIRAMDVMIAAMTAKGRAGKAEVLRMERDKIVKASEMIPPESQAPWGNLPLRPGSTHLVPGKGRPRNAAPSSALVQPINELAQDGYTDLAELMLDDAGQRGEADVVNLLFPLDEERGGARRQAPPTASPPADVKVAPAAKISKLFERVRPSEAPHESTRISAIGRGQPTAKEPPLARPREESPLQVYSSPDYAVAAEPLGFEDSRHTSLLDFNLASQVVASAEIDAVEGGGDHGAQLVNDHGHAQHGLAALLSYASQPAPDHYEVVPHGSAYAYAPSETALLDHVSTPPEPSLPVPPIPTSGLVGVPELFDHYWRQGFVSDARDLLEQTASHASHEPWWQARQALVGRTSDLDVKPLRLSVATSGETMLPAPPASADQFWQPLFAEMRRIAQSEVDAKALGESPARLRAIFAASVKGRELPQDFLDALASLSHRTPTCASRQLRNFYWDLIYTLWDFAPDASCAGMLEELDLTRLDFGFWGIYLDALVASGRSRRALVEILRGLQLNPQLGWANAAWRRLPRIWDALAVHGFAWTQDEGVKALIEKLSVRPSAKVSGMIAFNEGQ